MQVGRKQRLCRTQSFTCCTINKFDPHAGTISSENGADSHFA